MARMGASPFSGEVEEDNGEYQPAIEDDPRAPESQSKPLGAPEEYLGRKAPSLASCTALEGLEINLGVSSMEDRRCGLPTDPGSHKLTGHWLCVYHLEKELHGMLGGEG